MRIAAIIPLAFLTVMTTQSFAQLPPEAHGGLKTFERYFDQKLAVVNPVFRGAAVAKL